MSFIKDDDLQIRVDVVNDQIIAILAYDRRTKNIVRLGHVQGRQFTNKNGEWVSGPPDKYVADKVSQMVHRVLSDIQDLT